MGRSPAAVLLLAAVLAPATAACEGPRRRGASSGGGGQPPAEGEGEGEPPAEGEGEPPAAREGAPPAAGDGAGAPPVEGEGEPPAEGEGEGEPPAEGEGEGAPPTEGEGEGAPPAEGEGEGEVPPLPYCQPACTRASDCGVGSPAWDADNYACAEGQCVYTGCRSDQECTESYDRPFLCRETRLVWIPTCQQPCQRAADCVAAEMPAGAYDQDNYACEGGVCLYVGCHSDEECEQSLRQPYVCRIYPGAELSTCLKACGRAADCDLGSSAWDADNHRCEDGACLYTGCNSDQECRQTPGMESYVCRPSISPDEL